MRRLLIILALALLGLPFALTTSNGRAANTLCADLACPWVAGTSTSVNGTSVTVTLTVFTRGTNTSWHVEYGTGGSTSQFTSASQTITGDASGSSQDAMTLTGLTASTTYSYKVIATNAAGSNDSDVGIFTTGSPCDAGGCPAFTGLQVTGIGVDAATVQLSVYPRGSLTNWHVEYATDAVYTSTSAYNQTAAGTPNPVGPVDGSYSVQAPLTGLTPNTLYHYRVVASNSVGTSSTSDGTFRTLDPCTQNLCPDFTGIGVQGVSIDGGVVQANLYTRSSATSWWVEYGSSTSYGHATATVSAGTAEPQAIAAAISGMPYGSTIHYRFVGQNGWGTTRTADQTFTATDPCSIGYCPGISGTAVTPASLNGATVTTQIQTHGYDANWRVAYTLNGVTSYTTWTLVHGDNTGPSAVSQPLTGLAPGATYQVQIQAQNTYGTTTDPASGTRSYVQDVCSAPLSLCPDLTSDSATSLAWNTASVVATIGTKGIATTWHVRYGTTTSYGSTVDGPAIPADQTGASTVTAQLSGLTGSTTYHYQVYGENAAGSFVGPDHTFTTAVQPDPCTIGLCKPGINHDAVTPSSLNGANVTAGFQTYGLATTWQVEWGTDGVTYPNTTAVTTVPVDPANPTAIVDVAVPVSGLTPGGAYHFRILATNVNGTTTGADIPYVQDVCSAPLSLCPDLTSDSATNLTWNGASIVATIATKGIATTWHVRYGTTTSYGSTVDGPAIAAGASGATTIAADLTGLTGNTTYHYQVYGENAASTFVGPDHTLTTAVQPNPCTVGLCAPGIDHDAVVTTTLTGANVTAAFQTWGLATQWQVEWGTDGVTYPNTTAWTTVPTDPTNPNALVNVSQPLTGFTPHGAYHVRILVKNVNGTTTSPDVPYVQDVCGAGWCPTLGDAYTKDPAATEITVVADIFSKQLQTTWQVEYWDPAIVGGTHTTVSGPTIPPDQTGATTEAVRLTGLTANTTYDYVVHGQNAAGGFDSAVATLFTGPPPDPCTVGLCPAGGLHPVSVHAYRVVLGGDIFTYDSPTTWTVKYSVHVAGQTPTYADGSVAGTPLPAVQGGSTPVTIDIPGLAPTTTYDYEIVGTNGVGTATFGPGQFTTGPPFANTESLTWQRGPDLPKAWYAASTVDVPSGGSDRIYILGNDPQGRVYSIDPRGTSDEWRLEPGTAPYYTQEEGTVVFGSAIWLLGSGHYIGESNLQGFLTQTYDTSTGTWGMGPQLPDQRPRFGAMVAKVGTDVYLFGGRTVPGPGSSEFYTDAWKLSTGSGTWQQITPMPTPVSDAAVAAGNDGRIYFFGGVSCGGNGSVPGTCTPGSIVATVQVYDPSTGSWSTGTPLPSARYGAGADTLGGAILLAGGLNQLPTHQPDGTNVYPSALTTVDAYVYRDARWISVSPNLISHEEHAIVSSGRELWVVGGRSTDPLFETEYVTAPITISATPTPSAPDGANGWYVTRPSIQVEVTNGILGPKDVTTGFQGGSSTTQTYTAPFSVSAPDGVDVFQYSATDQGGNGTGTQSKTLKVDTVAPTGSFSASPTGYVFTASDATSGVAGVTISADGPHAATLLTATSGPYTVPFSAVPVGATTLTAKVTDVAGNVATVQTPVFVATSLALSAPASVVYGASATFAGVLRDASGNPLSGKTVTFAFGTQTCTGTTDATGTASCSLTVTQAPGSIADSAAYAGDGIYLGSNASGTTTVTKQPTVLTVTNAAGDYNDPTTVSAHLTGLGQPVAGATVTLAAGTDTCTGTTDAAGLVSCTLTPSSAAGTYPLTATFAGDAYRLGSTGAGTLTVAKEQTTLTVTAPPADSSGSATVSATLLEDGTTPIAGRTVTFTIDEHTYSAVTDATGTATVHPRLESDSYGIAAVFAGDTRYLPAAASGTLYVYQDTRFVVWGGNTTPLSAAVKVGDHVTFWGSQWAKQVTGGDYNGRNDFKGWADAILAPPGGWWAFPGNSSGPPESIGRVIAVIVTTHVTKSGRTTSGDVAEVALVRVDSEDHYESDPGHVGTGTVLALLPASALGQSGSVFSDNSSGSSDQGRGDSSGSGSSGSGSSGSGSSGSGSSHGGSGSGSSGDSSSHGLDPSVSGDGKREIPRSPGKPR